MKILHVIRAVASTYGGPSIAVHQMAVGLVEQGIKVDIVSTTADGNSELNVPIETPVLKNGVRYFYFPRQIGKTWCFSWPLTRWLYAHIKKYDLLHIHGTFTYPILIASQLAKRANIPYIIRPAGTLDSYCIAQKAWKKQIYYQTIFQRVLKAAAAIHATSLSEQNNLVQLGVGTKTWVIPLGVNVSILKKINNQTNSPLQLLFLSRIHPIKGLPVLFQALAIVKTQGVSPILTIAGDGEPDYVQKLKKMLDLLDLQEQVKFIGWVQGEKKTTTFVNSHLFILPSYHENFGIVVAEAMAVGLPVIITDQVAFSKDVLRSEAGVVVPIDSPELLAEAILKLSDPNIREHLAHNARMLIEEEFASTVQHRKLINLYEKLIYESR